MKNWEISPIGVKMEYLICVISLEKLFWSYTLHISHFKIYLIINKHVILKCLSVTRFILVSYFFWLGNNLALFEEICYFMMLTFKRKKSCFLSEILWIVSSCLVYKREKGISLLQIALKAFCVTFNEKNFSF